MKCISLIFTMLLIVPFFGMAIANPIALVTSNQITVDGNLSDWAQISARVISEKTHAVYKPQNWTGASDLQFTYRLAGSDARLYFAAEVTDDKVVEAVNASALLKSDHVEIWLDAPLLVAQPDLTLSEYPDYARQNVVQIALGSFGSAQDKPQITAIYYVPENQPNLAKQVTAAWTRTKTGYIVECAINPEGFYHLPNRPLSEIGLMIDVVDADNPAKPAQDLIFSTSPQRKFADPSTFTRVTFTKPLEIQSLKQKIQNDRAYHALSLCYPQGIWEWTAEEAWRSVVYELQAVPTETDIVWSYQPNTPQWLKTIALPGAAAELYVCTYPQNIAIAAIKDKTQAIGQASVSGFLLDQSWEADLGHRFTTAYEIQLFSFPDKSLGFSLSRVDYPRQGVGMCGAAESYATTFYRLTDTALKSVFTIESFPCMELKTKTWQWQETGKSIKILEFENSLEPSLSMDKWPGAQQTIQAVWNGDTFQPKE